jgi:hypothetical protein
MAFLLCHLKCEDYARWRSAFEAHNDLRQSIGSKGSHIFQSASDPNDVWITITFESQQAAQAMMGRDDVRQAIKDSGVIGEVQVFPIEDAGRTPA